MSKNERTVYVIGHKNPDTDAICASIAYANLKNKIDSEKYEARRCGNISSETQYVLDRFDMKAPRFIGDVRTQVRDMEINHLAGVSDNISLKNAWLTMKQNSVVTLCSVSENNMLEGILTTGDIMESYMGAVDPYTLSKAKTSYENIVDAVGGDMVVGDIKGTFSEGKVLIGAGTPDVMEDFIEKGDLVIVADRYESQLCAIEMEAACIIICASAKVPMTIQKVASEKGCRIISTPYDTFSVARLINQSIPISYFMVSEDLLTFKPDDYIEDIQPVMASTRHKYFPVVDSAGRYRGMVSRRNFLGASRKRLILVDHNEKSQAVNGMETAEILEIIDHHRLGTVSTNRPIFFRNQPLGSSCTIIYLMYLEYGVDIAPDMAGIMLSAIISDTLFYRSPTCTDIDRRAGRALAAIAGVDEEELANEMFRAGSNFSNKTPEEIVHQDFKKFSEGDTMIGIGQLSSMDSNELMNIKDKLLPELERIRNKDGLDMIFVMLTNILRESSTVIFSGDRAEMILENGFSVTSKDHRSVILPGVVSRKKQMLPTVTATIKQQ